MFVLQPRPAFAATGDAIVSSPAAARQQFIGIRPLWHIIRVPNGLRYIVNRTGIYSPARTAMAASHAITSACSGSADGIPQKFRAFDTAEFPVPGTSHRKEPPDY